MKKWAIIVISVLVLGVIFGMYQYNRGSDFVLYNDAKALEAEGKYSQAHDKVVEALGINPKNKKVLVYKTYLYNIVQNENFVKSAVKNREDAVNAMNRGDYVMASEKLDAALYDVLQVSPSIQGYDRAVELQKQLLKDTEKLLKEAPEKYYLQAVGYYQNGEYQRAYNSLEYILKPEPKVTSFKNDLAYRIGVEKYNECVTVPSPTPFLIKDAIMWLTKVNASSKNFSNSKVLIKNLNTILAKIEQIK